MPAGLTATAASSTRVDLSWTASTDNVGVTGYRVFRNGAQVGTPSTTSFSDTTAAPATTYSYTVAAVDAAGNAPAQSAAAPATTPPGAPASGRRSRSAASSFAANPTASSLTIPAPAGAQPGDVEVMAIAARGAPNFTAPAGWTLVRQDANGTTMRQAIYTHVVGTGEPASYTWTWATAQAAAGGILAYGGVSTVTPVDASGRQANASATSVTAPSIATAQAGSADRLLRDRHRDRRSRRRPGLAERGDVASSAGTFKVTLEAADVARGATGATGNGRRQGRRRGGQRRSARRARAVARREAIIALRPAAGRAQRVPRQLPSSSSAIVSLVRTSSKMWSPARCAGSTAAGLALAPQGVQRLLDGPDGGPHRLVGQDDHLEALGVQLLGGEVREERGHRDERHLAEARPLVQEALDLAQRLVARVDEDGVGTGLDVGVGALGRPPRRRGRR